MSKAPLVVLAALFAGLTYARTWTAQDVLNKLKETQVIDWSEVNAQVSTAVAAKITNAVDRVKAKTHIIGTPENLALLRSTKLADQVRKLALMKQICDAVVADEEAYEAGRIRWHGKHVSVDIDQEHLRYITTYADGFVCTNSFQRVDLLAESKKMLAKLPKAPVTNGVPVKLAQARQKWYNDRLTDILEGGSNVTRRVKAGSSAP